MHAYDHQAACLPYCYPLLLTTIDGWNPYITPKNLFHFIYGYLFTTIYGYNPIFGYGYNPYCYPLIYLHFLVGIW